MRQIGVEGSALPAWPSPPLLGAQYVLLTPLADQQPFREDLLGPQLPPEPPMNQQGLPMMPHSLLQPSPLPSNDLPVALLSLFMTPQYPPHSPTHDISRSSPPGPTSVAGRVRPKAPSYPPAHPRASHEPVGAFAGPSVPPSQPHTPSSLVCEGLIPSSTPCFPLAQKALLSCMSPADTLLMPVLGMC